MSQEDASMLVGLETRIKAFSEKLVALATREIKKSQTESVAFALDSVSSNFRLKDSHNLSVTGADMDMNTCPLCGIPDANGFCNCLGVMVKSEDMIDLKNASDTKKRIKEVPGPHEGKLPSDAPIKEVDVGDGSGGKITKGRIPGRKGKDMAKAALSPSGAIKPPAPPPNPAIQGMKGAVADMKGAVGNLPKVGATIAAPNAMATPRNPGQIKLPGMGMNHAPRVKQQAGGDIVSPNPPPAQPGLGSMKAPGMFKSEDFLGACALCGKAEHTGNC